ncbi:hypothetical protein DAEQUDRAFT_437776 [Daedalea quercina L-15889]|uniref:Uncharacterized protein n=1 Tax=Daedalea quercina L-15889 TaxID=1314783 RepID=A0A165NB00_9APHY|nr:hypothetical protein DAEQUDRAFT_437776 [Daedalea quercina L-15889]
MSPAAAFDLIATISPPRAGSLPNECTRYPRSSVGLLRAAGERGSRRTWQVAMRSAGETSSLEFGASLARAARRSALRRATLSAVFATSLPCCACVFPPSSLHGVLAGRVLTRPSIAYYIRRADSLPPQNAFSSTVRHRTGLAVRSH